MHTRLAVKLSVAASLAALLLLGCSRSSDSKPAAALPGQRTIAAIWADLLTQRDQIHLVFIKDMELVTHQDCRDMGAAAARMNELYSELLNVLGAQTTLEDRGRVRALGDAVGRASSVSTRIRESALMEAPGMWPAMRYPLDQSLRDVESYFTAADLNSESIVNRPGFEPTPLPPAPSAI
jgi:hypothetical protein